MQRKFVILLMMLLVAPAAFAVNADKQPDARTEATLDCATGERPQWEDLGMENLVASSQTTVEAPSSQRLARDRVSPTGGASMGQSRPTYHLRLSAPLPRHVHKAYLHKIVCLRL